MPQSARVVLREMMEKRVHDEMDDVLQRATRRRKSDSIARANAPGGMEGMSAPEQLRESGAEMFSLQG